MFFKNSLHGILALSLYTWPLPTVHPILCSWVTCHIMHYAANGHWTEVHCCAVVARTCTLQYYSQYSTLLYSTLLYRDVRYNCTVKCRPAVAGHATLLVTAATQQWPKGNYPIKQAWNTAHGCARVSRIFLFYILKKNIYFIFLLIYWCSRL